MATRKPNALPKQHQHKHPVFSHPLNAYLIIKGIMVNGTAPEPIGTPFIPSSLPAAKAKKFGKDQHVKRPGQLRELGPCCVLPEIPDTSYISEQILHPIGGEIVGG